MPGIASLFLRVSSALFFAVSSFLIVVINKWVLTSLKFPSYQFLGMGQMIAIVVVLQLSKTGGILTFPDFSTDIPQKIFPLPLLYLGNLLSGLGGTKRISLPMLPVLRRFSMLMTMFGEWLVLRNDLGFDAYGYSLVLLNDFFTATNAVYMKKKLDAAELGKNGLLFYNAAFMLPPTMLLVFFNGEWDLVVAYESWNNPMFLMGFIGACVMGFVLQYSIVLCTHYNSALTTSVIGSLKNIAVTYAGMFIGGDYIFSWPNFIGLNVSIVGSLCYTYVTFRPSSSESKKNHQNGQINDNPSHVKVQSSMKSAT
ncbi:unnamed protein product [Darwinula stevensoni]|uniref:Sugar phosphate transporter domain-containing protein n=1 Tax=Darwinula stevensoni TaxID=69355 RepID=A0A7R8X5N9_9CRUS|nr:unnamed protein product [Darwinula stevensoni]CAG0886828.1 unnamed protein product [Darwinula stevensoni]